MLNQATIDKMYELKLMGMIQAWESTIQSNQHVDLNLEEGLGLLVEHELIFRQNKKQQRLLKNAKLKYSQACLEDIRQDSSRKLSKDKLKSLYGTSWLEHGQNIILSGPTGVGKTYIACALAHNVCRYGYTVRYYRLSKLLEYLRIARADGSYLKLLAQLQKIKCLVIDDWGLESITEQQRNDLLEVIDDRYKQGSIIITSQLPVEHWHEYISEPTIADAILDRLLHNATTISITGESLRKNN